MEHLLALPPDFPSESDRRLFLTIRRRLWAYEPLRASRSLLEMEVTGGIVRLRGRVRTQAMKQIIDYLVRRLDGVRGFRDELISDTEVVRAGADALAADQLLGPLCLRLDARMGVVTLSGDLPSADLEQRAIEIVRAVPIVAGVESELVVRPLPTFLEAATTTVLAGSS